MEEQNVPKTCKIYQVGSLEVEKFRVFIEDDVSQKDDPNLANALAQQEIDKDGKKEAIEAAYRENPVPKEKDAWGHAWEKKKFDAEIERKHKEAQKADSGMKDEEKRNEETLDSETSSSSDEGEKTLFNTPKANNANIFKRGKKGFLSPISEEDMGEFEVSSEIYNEKFNEVMKSDKRLENLFEEIEVMIGKSNLFSGT